MKWKVIKENRIPKFFNTKREAIAYAEANGGQVLKKIGCGWY